MAASAQRTAGGKKVFVFGLVRVMFWKLMVILRPRPKHLPIVICFSFQSDDSLACLFCKPLSKQEKTDFQGLAFSRVLTFLQHILLQCKSSQDCLWITLTE